MVRKRRKRSSEDQEELNKQYLTIASLLIKIIGETAHGRLIRALLVGATVAAAEWATGGTELPEGALPVGTQSIPVPVPPTTVSLPK